MRHESYRAGVVVVIVSPPERTTVRCLHAEYNSSRRARLPFTVSLSLRICCSLKINKFSSRVYHRVPKTAPRYSPPYVETTTDSIDSPRIEVSLRGNDECEPPEILPADTASADVR